MLEVKLRVNLKEISSIVIRRDKTDFGRIRNYTIFDENNHEVGRVKDFDSDRGAWQLVSEALKVILSGTSGRWPSDKPSISNNPRSE